METFPSYLDAGTISDAPQSKKTALIERVACLLRAAIHDNLLTRDDPRNYIAIDDFGTSIGISMETCLEATRIIQLELKSIGWTTKLSFGDTALFIYRGDKPPVNCYDSSWN